MTDRRTQYTVLLRPLRPPPTLPEQIELFPAPAEASLNGNCNGHAIGQENGYVNGEVNGHTSGSRNPQPNFLIIAGDSILYATQDLDRALDIHAAMAGWCGDPCRIVAAFPLESSPDIAREERRAES